MSKIRPKVEGLPMKWDDPDCWLIELDWNGGDGALIKAYFDDYSSLTKARAFRDALITAIDKAEKRGLK